MVNPSLSQRLFGLEFANPVLAASGTFGYGGEFASFYDVSLLGGFMTKAVTPEPRMGNPAPRIVETPSGMLNAIGLQNEGLDAFLEKTVPRLAEMETVVIVNVAGRTADDYVSVCTALDGVSAIRAFEINISCPNVCEGGIAFGSTPKAALRLTRAVRGATGKPLIVKLSRMYPISRPSLARRSRRAATGYRSSIPSPAWLSMSGRGSQCSPT